MCNSGVITPESAQSITSSARLTRSSLTWVAPALAGHSDKFGIVGIAACKDNRQSGIDVPDFDGDFGAGHPRHLMIEDDDLGPHLPDHRKRRRSILGFP